MIHLLLANLLPTLSAKKPGMSALKVKNLVNNINTCQSSQQDRMEKELIDESGVTHP